MGTQSKIAYHASRQETKGKWRRSVGVGRFPADGGLPPRAGVMAGRNSLGSWWSRPPSWPRPAGGSELQAGLLKMEQPHKPRFREEPQFLWRGRLCPLTRCEPSMFCVFHSWGYFLPLPLLSEPTHSRGCMSQLLPWGLKERGGNNKGPILRSHLPCPHVLRQLWNAMMCNGGEVRTSTGLWHSNPTHTGGLRRGI